MKVVLPFALAFSIGLLTFSQEQDSVLTFKSFLQKVRYHHPMAQAAELKIKEGQAYITYYRGAFDPKILSNLSTKFYEGKEYFNHQQIQVKIPTYLGIEWNAGIERNKGVYLNPEYTVPKSGLMFSGLRITLGRGLITDQRRTFLRKAFLMQRYTEIERRKLLNDLLWEAAQVYGEWFQAYHILRIREQAYQTALQRFLAVKEGFFQGYHSAMDTLEAQLQVQSRQIALQKAQLNYQNASVKMNNYLWDRGEIPLTLPQNVIPQPVDHPFLDPPQFPIQEAATLVQQNPELLLFKNKLYQTQIERRWIQEQLKPVFNLKYQFLLEPWGNEWFANFSPNNYKWGVEFYTSLFLRKERGRLKLTNLKIQSTQYKIVQKEQMLKNKLLNYWNTYQNTQQQLMTLRSYVNGYYELMRGEATLFNTGESSLFKLNLRELKYIEIQTKYIEMFYKNQKSLVAMYYLLGLLPQAIQ